MRLFLLFLFSWQAQAEVNFCELLAGKSRRAFYRFVGEPIENHLLLGDTEREVILNHRQLKPGQEQWSAIDQSGAWDPLTLEGELIRAVKKGGETLIGKVTHVRSNGVDYHLVTLDPQKSRLVFKDHSLKDLEKLESFHFKGKTKWHTLNYKLKKLATKKYLQTAELGKQLKRHPQKAILSSFNPYSKAEYLPYSAELLKARPRQQRLSYWIFHPTNLVGRFTQDLGLSASYFLKNPNALIQTVQQRRIPVKNLKELRALKERPFYEVNIPHFLFYNTNRFLSLALTPLNYALFEKAIPFTFRNRHGLAKAQEAIQTQKDGVRWVTFSPGVWIAVGVFGYPVGFAYVNGLLDDGYLERKEKVIHDNLDLIFEVTQEDRFFERAHRKFERESKKPLSQEERDKLRKHIGEEIFARMEAKQEVEDLLSQVDPGEPLDKLVEAILGHERSKILFPAMSAVAGQGINFEGKRLRRNSGAFSSPGVEILHPDGKRATPKNPLYATSAQMEELMQINIDLFKKRALIQELISPTEALPVLLTDIENKKYYDELLGHPYVQALISLKKSKVIEIDDDELLVYLNEMLQIEEKFSRFKVLNARRYDESGNTITTRSLLMARLKHLLKPEISTKDFEANFNQLLEVDFYDHQNFDNSHVIHFTGPALAAGYAASRAPFYMRAFRQASQFLRRGSLKKTVQGKGGVKEELVFNELGGETLKQTAKTGVVTGLFNYAGTFYLGAWGALHGLRYSQVEGEVTQTIKATTNQNREDVVATLAQKEALDDIYEGVLPVQLKEAYLNSGNSFLIDLFKGE